MVFLFEFNFRSTLDLGVLFVFYSVVIYFSRQNEKGWIGGRGRKRIELYFARSRLCSFPMEICQALQSIYMSVSDYLCCSWNSSSGGAPIVSTISSSMMKRRQALRSKWVPSSFPPLLLLHASPTHTLALSECYGGLSIEGALE